MADAAFDTLATARLLRESGIEERQAAAITTAIKDGVTGGVATKADLAELRGELRSDMADLRSELRNDMADLRSDMASLETRLTVRIVVVGLALNSVTAAAVVAAVGWMLAG
ncbi:MAG: hypothetical protein F4213_20285 [Boseongicola sp. SB0677_bin_26]|nr:hypothetical protein [Boseongicola sp. SB0665_bin_10]MYG28325.1 hypothetical protein [Boseongicola sp. SB0677_bin_26]